MTINNEQIQARAEQIIDDMKIKHGGNDFYAPVMLWGEFLSLLAERDADKALIAELKPIAAHAQRGWQEAHEQEALVEQAMTRIDEQAKRIAELEAAASCKFMPVGVMSQSRFENLDDGSVRFIALWPRPGVAVRRKRPDDGVLVYAKVAGITLDVGE